MFYKVHEALRVAIVQGRGQLGAFSFRLFNGIRLNLRSLAHRRSSFNTTCPVVKEYSLRSAIGLNMFMYNVA